MDEIVRDQSRLESAFISAGVAVTCASGPGRCHYVSVTDHSRAQADRPTRASADVPETGDAGDQSGRAVVPGAGLPRPQRRIASPRASVRRVKGSTRDFLIYALKKRSFLQTHRGCFFGFFVVVLLSMAAGEKARLAGVKCCGSLLQPDILT